MKKITYFLTLLLLCVAGTLSAQPDVTGKTFTLNCARGYVYYNGSVLAGTNDAASASEFAIVEYESNNYLYDVTNSKFVVHTTAATAGTTGNASLESATDFSKALTGLKWGNTNIAAYPYYLADSFGNWLNMDGSPLVYMNTWKDFENGTGGNTYNVTIVNTTFDATAATQMLENYFHPAATVSFKFVDGVGNELLTTSAEPATLGETISAVPSKYAFAFTNFDMTPTTIATGENVITVTCTFNLPFETFTSFEDATWYKATIRGSYWIRYQDSEPYYPTATYEENDNFRWAFSGNPVQGIKIYNRATGSGKTLTVSGSNAVMRDGEATWDIFANSDGFVLRQTGTNNNYINQNGGASGYLGFWNSAWGATDNGSTWRITALGKKADLLLIDCGAAKTTLQNIYDNYTFSDNYGEYALTGDFAIYKGMEKNIISDIINMLNDAMGQDAATQEQVLTPAKALIASIALNMPANGAALRIKSTNNNTYLSGNVNGSNRYKFISDGTDASTIFFWVDGKLLSYGAATELHGRGDASQATDFSFEISPANSTAYAIIFNPGSGGNRALYAQAGGYADQNGYSGRNHANCVFELEKVTEVPVTLTNVADGYYSTLYMPVPVEVSGAEVYTAQLVGEDLRAVALAGAIPANTGVILKGTTTEATANIVNAADAVETALTGTVGAVAPVAGSYVFSIVGDDLGFYSFGGDELKGFKAYYVSASPVQGFKLDFGSATAIKQAETTKAGQAIYDLSGRRVEKAVKGVYIVGGKKVIK